MNWDTIEGNWKQLTGQAKSQWGKLTGDDLRQIAGRRDQLAGKIQERYGIAKEEAEKLGTRQGMIKALSSTGGVITSAGVLLAAVFAVLGVLPLVALAQIGVIVCIGVLLDTLLVRTVIVPALAFITGKKFWAGFGKNKYRD